MNSQPPEYDDPRDDEDRMNDGIRAVLTDKLGFSIEERGGCPVIVEDGETKPADLEHRVLWDEVVSLTAARDSLRAVNAEAAQSLPDGWKLVPINPTTEMLYAADREFGARGIPSIAMIAYQTMIAASPAQPVQPSSPWMPIETAPKDSTLIILRGKEDRHADGYWQPTTIFTGAGHWVWPYINREPTHWMPLPPAPQPKD